MEIEFKFLLASKADAEKLRNFLKGEDSPLHQINRFYDYPDASLSKADMSLRWRIEVQTHPRHFQTEHVLALKGPNIISETGTNLTARQEEEKVISGAQVWEVLAGKSLLSLMEQTELVKLATKDISPVLVGGFCNTRWRAPAKIKDRHVVFEIDETKFSSSVVHYEVELEIEKDEVEESDILAVFEQAGVKALPDPPSGKAARFFRSLKNGESSL